MLRSSAGPQSAQLQRNKMGLGKNASQREDFLRAAKIKASPGLPSCIEITSLILREAPSDI